MPLLMQNLYFFLVEANYVTYIRIKKKEEEKKSNVKLKVKKHKK